MSLPFVDATVGSSVVVPTGILIKQADYAHEVATLTVPRTLLPYHGREENQPVQIKWGNYPGTSATFYGYVHHTEPYYEKREIDRVRLVCLGATSVLSQPIQRIWTNRTADSVAREIVERVYLSIDAEPHSKVWPVLSAGAPLTVWEYLVELAGKVGFILQADGTEVRFLSPNALFSRYGPLAPVLTYGPDFTRFRPQLGNKEQGVGTKRVLHGVNQRDGSLFSVSDSGPQANFRLGSELPDSPFVQLVSATADSPGDGADKLAAMAETDRFTYRATAEFLGDAAITPGTVLYLTGLETTQNGHWYVQAVEHDLNIQDRTHTSYLVLGRDALGPYVPSSSGAGVLTLMRPTPTGDVMTASPPSVLVSGRWRSGWARRAS